MDFTFEKKLFQKGYQKIIGIDEAGRGPLAGPVFAGAVLIKKRHLKILKKYENFFKKVKDSKKLNEKTRKEIFNFLKKEKIFFFSYSFVQEKTIDKINIEKATKKAMKNCLKKLNCFSKKNKKTIILVDGNNIIDKNLDIKQVPIIKGDNKIFTIALASIIAKVKRDEKMVQLSKKYPLYKFEKHKGYPTKLHLTLIKKYGISEIHRKSYQPIKSLNKNL